MYSYLLSLTAIKHFQHAISHFSKLVFLTFDAFTSWHLSFFFLSVFILGKLSSQMSLIYFFSSYFGTTFIIFITNSNYSRVFEVIHAFLFFTSVCNTFYWVSIRNIQANILNLLFFFCFFFVSTFTKIVTIVLAILNSPSWVQANVPYVFYSVWLSWKLFSFLMEKGVKLSTFVHLKYKICRAIVLKRLSNTVNISHSICDWGLHWKCHMFKVKSLRQYVKLLRRAAEVHFSITAQTWGEQIIQGL